MSHNWVAACRRVTRFPCVILAVGGFGYLALTVGPEESESEPVAPPKIRTTVTELAVVNYPVSVRTHATVQPRNHVIINAEVAGRIVKIHPNFEVGSYFSKGDVLIELDEEDVTQQEISYENALANKILAASQVEVAKTSIKEYLEGNYQTELAAKEMALVVSQTNLKSAKDMHGHAQKMFRKGYVSSFELGSKADTVKHAKLEVKTKTNGTRCFQEHHQGQSSSGIGSEFRCRPGTLGCRRSRLETGKTEAGS